MKRVGLILVCLALPALVFAGGGGQKQKDSNYLRYAWWGNTVRDERTKRVIALFEQKNPGITIEAETTGWDDYWVKINTQAASGSLPDVMQQDYPLLNTYNEKNLLVDMQQFVKSGIIDLSKWPDDVINSGKLAGKLLGLSLGTNAWGMGIDPAILQRAGVTIDDTKWTWKDYEQIALTIYQKTGVQTLPFTEFDQIPEHIVRQFGATLFSKDGKSLGFTSNSAAMAAVKEIFLDMPLRLKAAGALFNPEEAFIEEMAMEERSISTGKTWNSFHWSNEHVGMVEAAGKPLVYYLTPVVNENKAPFGTYLQPSQFMSMLTTSKKQELGAKFVNFFINDMEANRILMAERGIPAPTDVRADLAGRVDAATKYTFDYISRITPFTSPIDPPAPDAVDEMRDMTGPIILQCYLGQLSSDAAMNQLIRTANEILGQ